MCPIRSSAAAGLCKAGWDTHGLPVELGVEKTLGITKEDIGKKISVDEYNDSCRREVMKFTDEWEKLSKNTNDGAPSRVCTVRSNRLRPFQRSRVE